jgi:hypothetical protein
VHGSPIGQEAAVLVVSAASVVSAVSAKSAESPLLAWQSFYVIVGSSAGALTGLTFVVILLIAAVGAQERTTSQAVAAFTTPTVFHFGAALFNSVLLSAPWPALWQAGLLLVLAGLGGVAYEVIVVRRLRRQEAYSPVMEDWLWYAAMPLVAYAGLVVSALLLPSRPAPALFGIGAVTALLLFGGIHNAWDLVTYLAVEYRPPQNERED